MRHQNQFGSSLGFTFRMDEYLSLLRGSVMPSTIRGYLPKAKRLKAYFNTTPLSEICQTDILKYRQHFSHLSNKTLREDQSLLNRVFELAIADGLIDRNPIKGIAKLRLSGNQADPFTRAELELIIKHSPENDIYADISLLCSYTGLRVSEAIALAYEDIDWQNRLLRVQRAAVLGEYKITKTDGSERDVEINELAFELLRKIQHRTENRQVRTISVLQLDKKTRKKVHVRFLFYRPQSRKVFTDSRNLANGYKKVLMRAGVRHRGISQTRHTFASQAITAGVNLHWLAAQLGHSDTTMIYRHYGKFIKDDNRNQSSLLTHHLRRQESAPAESGLRSKDDNDEQDILILAKFLSSNRGIRELVDALKTKDES
ncbi:tyrosine-type recombinase/integrase [Grimontia hollisae]|uniref:tyrosine-type recombinase/integrase n=1 Tax=Grimontia hollisae TaxID=673 RepID=UPI00165E535B|nr:site-specific integrase [Grimontia hollisae]